MKNLYCATLLLFCAGAGAWAQRRYIHISPQPDSSPQVTTAPATPGTSTVNPRQINPAVGLIQLDVTVTDASGKTVTGLDRTDFTLFDNDKPARILTFHASDQAVQMPNGATELILVLDQLNLNTIDANEAEELVDVFLRQNDGHLALPTSIYRLTDHGLSATAQPSTDGNALADELAKRNKLHPILPATPFYMSDQANQSVMLSRFAIGSIALNGMRKPGRKLVVWIGYGWHGLQLYKNLNFYEISEISTRLREARITLYRVNAWDDPKANAPKLPHYERKNEEGFQIETDQIPVADMLNLEVLAMQSGGADYGITTMNVGDYVKGHPSPDQMAHIVLDSLGRIIAENRSSYSLSFDPPHSLTPDEYHKLKIEIAKPGLIAHTGVGYYDEPVFYDQLPHHPVEHLSIAQLEQLLEQSQHKSESQLAGELSNIGLTERMSSAKLNAWKNRLPDKKAWQALVAVADASIFLPLPAAEIPSLPEPPLAEQREQLVRIVNYLSDLAPKLPNLLATRTTDLYGEPKPPDSETWKVARTDRSLHLETSTTVTVRYQNGEDSIESGSRNDKKAKKDTNSLETNGTFGAILTTVVSDAIYGKMTWGGWETGASSPMAVIRYSVPESQSHYTVTSCCYPEYMGGGLFQRMTGYHGTIAYDPASGTILRLTVQPDLSEKLPLMRSDIAVEYGPVETGGSTYICPVKSVSISRGRTLRTIPEWGGNLQIFGPFETLLTDVSFRDYHRFGSTSRILTDDTDAP